MYNKREIGRQILHAFTGIFTIILIQLNILSKWAIFLLIIAGILVSILSKRIDLPFFSFFLKHFEREKDRKSFPGKGMIFFFIGSLLALELFEKDIALAAIMILALGDSISHLIGRHFGKLSNIFNIKGNKLFEGTVAGTLAGTLGALFFVPLPEALIASFAAMVAEVIQIDFNENTIDDNLVVPLVAGTVIFLMRLYL